MWKVCLDKGVEKVGHGEGHEPSLSSCSFRFFLSGGEDGGEDGDDDGGDNGGDSGGDDGGGAGDVGGDVSSVAVGSDVSGDDR